MAAKNENELKLELLDQQRRFISAVDAYVAERREVVLKRFPDLDLRPWQVSVVELLQARAPVPVEQQDIEKLVEQQVKQSMVSTGLKELKKNYKLIDYRTDERDGRKKVWALTETGQVVGEQLADAQRAGKLRAIDAIRFDNVKEIDYIVHAIQSWADAVTAARTNARPSPGGIYDYLIGGSNFTAADKEFAETVLPTFYESENAATRDDMTATMRAQASENRSFLRRSVRWLADEKGITQFIDLGSGYPTHGHVHQIASRHLPGQELPRVVYVDKDPNVVRTAELLLGGQENVRFLGGDFEESAKVLANPEMKLLDFGKPIAVLLIALLHFVPDDAIAKRNIKAIVEALPAGSYIVASHGVKDGKYAKLAAKIESIYSKKVQPIRMREPAAIVKLFAHKRLELVAPCGQEKNAPLPWLPDWRPEIQDDYVQGGSLFRNDPDLSLNRAILASIKHGRA